MSDDATAPQGYAETRDAVNSASTAPMAELEAGASAQPDASPPTIAISLIKPSDGWSPPATDRLYTDGATIARVRFSVPTDFGSGVVEMTAAWCDANGWVRKDATGAHCVLPDRYAASGSSAPELTSAITQVASRIVADAARAAAIQTWADQFLSTAA